MPDACVLNGLIINFNRAREGNYGEEKKHIYTGCLKNFEHRGGAGKMEQKSYAICQK